MKTVTKIVNFYVEGFKKMTLGRTLWIIILIKLFILFVILKLFFFCDFLNSKFSDDAEKSNYVLENLSKP